MSAFINSYQIFLNSLYKADVVITLSYLSAVFLCSILLMFILQVFIHESGHFIFGLMTGYRLLSFRIFSFVLIKSSKKWRIKRYQSTGSYGQCIMLPQDNKNKVFLHVMGGVLLNLLVSGFAGLEALNDVSMPFIIRVIILIFSFYGVGFAIINGIPFRTQSVVTDGTLMMELRNDPIAVQCYFNQIEIAAYLMEGKSYGEIPYELFECVTKDIISKALIGYHKILEYYYYLEKGKFINAKECLDELKKEDKLCKMISNIIHKEQLLFMALVGEKAESENEYFQCFVDATKDLNGYRITKALDILNSRDTETVNQIIREVDRVTANYLYPGEVKFCKTMLEKLSLMDYR